MEHNGAIAQFIMPMLLALLCGLASYGLHITRALFRQLEEKHERLAQTDELLRQADEKLREADQECLVRITWLEANQNKSLMDHERRLTFCENELRKGGGGEPRK